MYINQLHLFLQILPLRIFFHKIQVVAGLHTDSADLHCGHYFVFKAITEVTICLASKGWWLFNVDRKNTVESSICIRKNLNTGDFSCIWSCISKQNCPACGRSLQFDVREYNCSKMLLLSRLQRPDLTSLWQYDSSAVKSADHNVLRFSGLWHFNNIGPNGCVPLLAGLWHHDDAALHACQACVTTVVAGLWFHSIELVWSVDCSTVV